MTWFAVGSAVIGAGASLLGSSKAKKAQKKASKNALALQEAQFNTTREDNMPALQARNNALAQMQTLSQQFGTGPTREEVLAEPGYQFGLMEGRNALEGSAAARGGLYSGKAGKDLAKWGNDYGSTKYGEAWTRKRANEGDAFDRQRSLATGGQAGASTIASAGQNYANNAGDIGMGLANAYAGSAISNANTLGNFANQAGSALKGWWNTPASFNPTPGVGGNGSGGSPDGYYADGGPVIDPNATYSAPYMAPMQMSRVRRGIQPVRPMYRGMRSEPAYADGGPVMEPRVGTKAPVREGGGGGLSKNALLLLLINKNLEGRQRAAVNPLNPRAVNAEREERVGLAGGGPVQGPGGPREDAIPARLSNGEHVIDEESVTALGDGDNMLGQLKLNGLRAMLKGAY